MPSLYGINIHYAYPGYLELLAPAGLAVARVDINMDMNNPHPGVYHWDYLDQQFLYAAQVGVALYPTLAHVPYWAAEHNNAPPFDVNAWYWWVAHVVWRYQHFSPVWSVWNEPNIHGTSPEEYVARVLAPACAAIRTYAPNALIVGPEMATQGNWQSWLSTFLAIGGQYLDGLAVHAYGPNGRDLARRMIEGKYCVRAYMERLGYWSLPLLLTEFGWNTANVGAGSQATYYGQFLEYMDGRSDPCLCLAYQLVDEDPSEHWGIVHSYLFPKPAYNIFTERLRTGVQISS